MIPLAGSWLRNSRGQMVNLAILSDIGVFEIPDHGGNGKRFIVSALQPFAIACVPSSVTLFEADTRGECDAYLAELFDTLQDRDLANVRPAKSARTGPDGYPTYFSRGPEPRPTS